LDRQNIIIVRVIQFIHALPNLGTLIRPKS